MLLDSSQYSSRKLARENGHIPNVLSEISTKTGSAPNQCMALHVATKVIDCVMTSSSRVTPAICNAACSPLVPFTTATAAAASQ